MIHVTNDFPIKVTTEFSRLSNKNYCLYKQIRNIQSPGNVNWKRDIRNY